MAPIIPDGIYTIGNVQFYTKVADLLDGIPGGVIGGLEATQPAIPEQKWIIKNSGYGGNQITIENWGTRGFFATAQQLQGAQLVGGFEPTVWTVVKVDQGYYLQSPDADYVWELPNGKDYKPLILVNHTGQDNTKWKFIRVK